MIKLHIGCGHHVLEGWENYDASPTLRLQRIPFFGACVVPHRMRFPEGARYGDIVKGLPLGEGVASHCFSSHVFEHLSCQDFRTALSNVRQVLSAGGVFRCIMPCLADLVRNYEAGDRVSASVEFMRRSLLGMEFRPRGMAGFLRQYFGNSRHLWLWDYESCKKELGVSGFADMRRAEFSDNNEFVGAERESDFVGSFCIEARRE